MKADLHTERTLTRGQLAKRAGVGIEALRFYENRGLIPKPRRDSAGYRRYPEESARRLRFIAHAKSLGFSLREIHELLNLRDLAGETCGDVRDRISAKLVEVERKLRTLTLLKTCLENLAAACDGRRPIERCPSSSSSKRWKALNKTVRISSGSLQQREKQNQQSQRKPQTIKIRTVLTVAGLVMSISLAGLVAQAQQNGGDQNTSMMEMMGLTYDQCLQVMKESGMSPGMMMRTSMMGALEVDPYDPAAVLAMKSELNFTPDQQEKIGAIQKDAREKTRALLTETQQNELKPPGIVFGVSNSMWRQWHARMSRQSGSAMMMCPWMGR